MDEQHAVPVATYRLQLGPEFGFQAVAQRAPYLAALGISHVYLSPILQAAPGSTHGYDVVNHQQVSQELGGEDGFKELLGVLQRHGLGIILDVVPNHMSISTQGNDWWWDVLENGPASLYAGYFDVDWQHPDARLRHKVLVPILGDHYGKVMAAGQISVQQKGAAFTIRVYEHLFPVAPISLAEPLVRAAQRCGSDELMFAADVLERIPRPTELDETSISLRHRDKAVVGRMLARLFEQEPAVAAAVDAVLDEVTHSPEQLHALLEAQNYRLAFWKMARADLDYRRFFDINELAALRMGEQRVFEDTHRRVMEWLESGAISGLRIDHPDGLRDPREYLERLRLRSRSAWIVVEKILEAGEELPRDWPVEGTTGYDFMNMAGGLFVDPAGQKTMEQTYAEFCGKPALPFAQLAMEKKSMVVRQLLASDLSRLTEQLVTVCERHLPFRDYTRHELRTALEAMLVAMPVYRTYIRQDVPPSAAEKAHLEEALERARVLSPSLDPALLQFVHDLLSGQFAGDAEFNLVVRFQQLSGPVMAKGVEDTAYYCQPKLLSLNEVGGEPDRFGVSVEAFHAWCQDMVRNWPLTMVGSSTHDTKRSEDTRVRISLLSEIPEQWAQTVKSWSTLNKDGRTGVWPDAVTEYLFYQTLVGAWPLSEARALEHLRKAVKEAKVHTSWHQADAGYEEALEKFIRYALANAPMVESLEVLTRQLERAATVHGLSQMLLKCTAVGVPDVYQGTELWSRTLTDPDNRRPVDYNAAAALLAGLDKLSMPQLLQDHAGAAKMFVLRHALATRRARAAAFERGSSYLPLTVTGAHASRVVAFARSGEVATVVPRLVMGLKDRGWGDTSVTLPPGSWRNVFTGERYPDSALRVESLWATFPVALLVLDAAEG